MTHNVEGVSSSQRVEDEAFNSFIINGKEISMTTVNIDTMLRLLLEEKLTREVVKAET